MTLTVEAIYENGVLKPVQPLPLKEHDKVQVTVHTPSDVPKGLEAPRRSGGLIPWTGTVGDLDYLIEDIANDPLEGP